MNITYQKCLLPLTLFFLLGLTGCGGGSGTTTDQASPDPTNTSAGPKSEKSSFSPEKKNLSSFILLDADKQPVPNVVVSLSDNTAVSAVSAVQPTANYTSDANGVVSGLNLAAGNHKIAIQIPSLSDNQTLLIDVNLLEANSLSASSFMAPMSINPDGSFKNLSATAVISSISGIIYDKTGPVSGAQVSISSGTSSNGAISTVLSKEDGSYTLNINASIKLAASLQNATISVILDKYAPQTLKSVQVIGNTNTSGQNFNLFALNDSGTQAPTVLFEETFEQSSPTVSLWSVGAGTSLDGSDVAFQSLDPNVNHYRANWHIHTSGLSIINQAFTSDFVQLAPNDMTSGIIPDPKQGGQAFWYGNSGGGSAAEKGNFIDTQETGDEVKSGGTSEDKNSGTLTSPEIDLTAVSGPISLTFDTFWEIESVNPNANGYDLMTVSTSIDEGKTWKDVARLNPLSDPQTNQERSSLPFSNTGFNSAPIWTKQESIPLKGIVGHKARIRFSFETVDELYNGFRGWLIDDVVLQQSEGTAPLLSDEGDYLPNQTVTYAYINLDADTGKPQISPLPYDEFSGFIPLTVNTDRKFDVTLGYYASESGTIRLKLMNTDSIDYPTAASKASAFVSSSIDATNSSGSFVTLSGTTKIPEGSSGIVLYLEILNSAGQVAYQQPIEFYQVK